MTGNIHAMAAIAVMAAVTLAIRVLPFLIFREGNIPGYIDYLGKVLPYAIIGMLVVFCLKDVSFLHAPFGLPELAAVALVALLHVWKRNTLLSIVGGTAFYMVVLQLIA